MNRLIRRLRRLFGMTDAGSTSESVTNHDSDCIRIDGDEGVFVVRFQDLDSVVADCRLDKIRSLARKLFSVVEQHPRAVILDFEDKDFTPVAAFECVLVGLNRRLDRRLVICNLPTSVFEYFEMTNLSTLLKIYNELDDARQGVLSEIENPINTVDIKYDCSNCRQSFSVNVRLDGCMAPMPLNGTHQENCPHCGQPAWRSPFLALPSARELLLEGDRWLIGRLPHELQHLKTLEPHARVIERAMCVGQWIYVDDACVSRRHAMLTRAEDGVVAIEDTGSRSGTFVNDQLVRGKVTLKVGDTIRIGQTRIGYCDFSHVRS